MCLTPEILFLLGNSLTCSHYFEKKKKNQEASLKKDSIKKTQLLKKLLTLATSDIEALQNILKPTVAQ